MWQTVKSRTVITNLIIIVLTDICCIFVRFLLLRCAKIHTSDNNPDLPDNPYLPSVNLRPVILILTLYFHFANTITKKKNSVYNRFIAQVFNLLDIYADDTAILVAVLLQLFFPKNSLDKWKPKKNGIYQRVFMSRDHCQNCHNLLRKAVKRTTAKFEIEHYWNVLKCGFIHFWQLLYLWRSLRSRDRCQTNQDRQNFVKN